MLHVSLGCLAYHSYNTFKIMNVLSTPNLHPEENLARFFSYLGNPARLQILLLIGTGEACVCHLKAALNQRQAYISQQLMILRNAGLVTSFREGRNIYYRLTDPGILEWIYTAAQQQNIAITLPAPEDLPGCPYHTEKKPE